MTDKTLMLLGIVTGLIGMVTVIVSPSGTAAVIAFGGGALFGKGYGIREERERRRPDKPDYPVN